MAAVPPILASAGWIFQIDPFKQIHPLLPAMQPNTAFGLVLSAIAILFTGENRPASQRWVAFILAVVILFLGLLTLGEYFFAWDLGIDRVLMGSTNAANELHPGRPSPQTSGNFALLGAALLFYNLEFFAIRLGQVCAVAVSANATVAVTGYIFSTNQFYGFPAFVSDIGMAVHTAASFILLTAALLCSRPMDGMMSLLTSGTRSSGMARRILLTATLAPPLVGALTLIGVSAGWYDTHVQVSLFVVVLVTLLLRATWQAARQSENDELRTRAALEESQNTNETLSKVIDERRIFEALIENSSDFIGIADPDGKATYLNPAGRRMLGMAQDYPIENAQILDCYTPAQRSFAFDVILKGMAEQGHWKGETYFRNWQTEEAIPVSDEHFLIKDTETGRVLGMGTITRDISETRRSQEEIRQSEERFELALRGADLGAWDWDVKSGKVIFNARWAEMRGFRLEEIKPHVDSWISGIHSDDWPRVQKAVADYFQGLVPEYESEFRALTKSGEWIWILDRGKVFTRDEEGQPIRMVGTELDITERKRLENEQRFLAEVGAVLTSTLDYEDTLENIAEMAVRNFSDLCIVDVVNENGVRRLKVASRDPSNTWACNLFNQIPLDGNKPNLLKSVLESKRPVLMENLSSEMIASFSESEEDLQALRAADLKSVMAVPLLARGKLVGVITFISCSSTPRYGPADVYLAEELARRAALSIENARLLSEAQLAVKIRDEVLAVVAHDLGNPVAAISITTKLLRQFEQVDRAKLDEFTNRILRSADNMRTLIGDLLDFARIQSGTFSVVKHACSLLPLIMTFIDGTRVQAEVKQQTLEVDVPPNLPKVVIDAQRIGQVIANLLGNAVKFTPEGGKIRLSARHIAATVIVSVSDTGPGIAPEDLSKVFDRFWQGQRAKYKGSGLGLSIAKGIVDAHGGAIWAESKVPHGSSFSFTLPTVNPEGDARG